MKTKQIKQTKISLTDLIYRSNSEYKLKSVKSIIDDFLDAVSDSLKKGDAVELRGFGTFEVRVVKGKKNARNPKTGEPLVSKDHCKVKFKPSKDLQDSVKRLNVKRFKDEG